MPAPKQPQIPDVSWRHPKALAGMFLGSLVSCTMQELGIPILKRLLEIG